MCLQPNFTSSCCWSNQLPNCKDRLFYSYFPAVGTVCLELTTTYSPMSVIKSWFKLKLIHSSKLIRPATSTSWHYVCIYSVTDVISGITVDGAAGVSDVDTLKWEAAWSQRENHHHRTTGSRRRDGDESHFKIREVRPSKDQWFIADAEHTAGIEFIRLISMYCF